MIATIVNFVSVLLGGGIGLAFGNRIKTRYTDALFSAMGLCVLGLGISSSLQTNNAIHLVVCLSVGTVLGEALRIEDRLDNLGGWLKARFVREGDASQSRFTEGFLTATLLFCVGSMAIMGSLDAGIRNDYTVIFSKSLIDGVTAVGLAASMGPGVLFSGVILFIYQGAITLLSGWVAPFLQDAVVVEMTAIGGLLLIGMGFNMLKHGKPIRLANMLPAIFLPIVYIPLIQWIQGLL